MYIYTYVIIHICMYIAEEGVCTIIHSTSLPTNMITGPSVAGCLLLGSISSTPSRVLSFQVFHRAVHR